MARVGQVHFGNRTYPQKYFVGIFVGSNCGLPCPKYLIAKQDFFHLDSASGHHPHSSFRRSL
ncbi:hypothetical protein MPL3365_130507 [Mesorhizobium plurifarium]|uniref:Uncharacterized protein n=1 Tax=Mesorhizobium plurifarium TaxID=69974 RepID=A0A090GSY2_MESPL|nr:hypothetical protein MPL3365_130507 [Mesorhizobium plurifarium]